ncbi:RNHCP domain-containing protein (plasmid) [Rhodococcus sp. PSBB049]|nr:RNHCP domain-containing protein [Rhodococcus sp. PSBB049]
MSCVAGSTGLPLAIELAAVRMRTFWLGHLLERLDDRYRVLGSGDRFEAPRHRTSWVSIDWSYELCSESERRTWARLANFPRCPRSRQPRRWAEAGTAEQVLDDVCGLVDKSVLLRDDAHHQPRYAHCLSGRYVDCVRGDRAADCSGRIEPISVTGRDRVSICWRRVCGELGAHHCAGTTTRVRSFASCCGQSPRRTCPSTGSDRRHGGRVLEMDSVPCRDRGAASAGNPMTGVAVPQLLTSLLSPMPSGGPAPTGGVEGCRRRPRSGLTRHARRVEAAVSSRPHAYARDLVSGQSSCFRTTACQVHVWWPRVR